MKEFFTSLASYQKLAIIGTGIILLMGLFVHTVEPSTTGQISSAASSLINDAANYDTEDENESDESSDSPQNEAMTFNLIFMEGAFTVINIISCVLALIGKYKIPKTSQALLLGWNILGLIVTWDIMNTGTNSDILYQHGVVLKTPVMFVIQIIFELAVLVVTAVYLFKSNQKKNQ